MARANGLTIAKVNRLRILYMGTPGIAVAPLRALARRYDVAGVFCRPDKPAGRKRELKPPATKIAAAQLSIRVFQPESLKSSASLELIESLAPDLIAVMAYGQILPKDILSIPKYGCINAHASLLPKYRGAAPVQYALMNGDVVTGVTIIRMDEGIDTGEILSAAEFAIADEDDAVSVFSKVSETAADLLPETTELWAKGKITAVKQDEDSASYAPMIKKETGRFSFSEDARVIHNRIRGLCAWPAAYFEARGKIVKVFKSAYVPERGSEGEVLSLKPLTVAASGGALALIDVLPASGKRMDGASFAAGLRLKKGDIL